MLYIYIVHIISFKNVFLKLKIVRSMIFQIIKFNFENDHYCKCSHIFDAIVGAMTALEFNNRLARECIKGWVMKPD